MRQSGTRNTARIHKYRPKYRPGTSNPNTADDSPKYGSCLLTPCNARRFATNFIMLERLYKEKDASAETTADRRYTQWLNGTISGKKKGAKQYKAEGVWVKSKVNDEDWWSTVSTILTVITPIVELLRLGDSTARSR